MTQYNRTEQLKEIHKKRKINTATKVDSAIKTLIKQNESITFNSVSKESGVARSTLYNNKEFKARIESLIEQQSHVPSPIQVKREMNEKNKDALIASLKRKIKKLEEENNKLKEQVKLNYGEIYKNI
ncbi:DUF6262 family protein [Clostridium baratii]|uniref:DUF6262 family protein n=1 Tax=Clostridium baratii TaxID=1561 RepID=UPI0030D0D497